jgi:hypothetical protein
MHNKDRRAHGERDMVHQVQPNDSRLSCPASHCRGAGGNVGEFLRRFQTKRISRVSFSRLVRRLVIRRSREE